MVLSGSGSRGSRLNQTGFSNAKRPSFGLQDYRFSQICELSDEDLLAQIRQGDKEAVGYLFGRHARIVRTIAYRILRDEAEAEDLLQDVFLFIFRKAALFDASRGSARSWLIQVAYHRAFDRRRYLTTRRFYSNIELEESLAKGKGPSSPLTSQKATLLDTLGRGVLRRIQESLTEAQRRVIRLHFVDGYCPGEIAIITGQSVGNVRNHLYRALERMRRQIHADRSEK